MLRCAVTPWATEGWRIARRLQMEILRPDGPLPGDAAPTADWLMLGAWAEGGGLVGSAAVCPESWPRPDLAIVPEPAWHFRSLAVLPEFRGTGIGSALVRECCAAAWRQGASGIWAEARVAALSLYRRTGWTVAGDEWYKPGVGPHRFVWRTLLDS